MEEQESKRTFINFLLFFLISFGDAQVLLTKPPSQAAQEKALAKKQQKLTFEHLGISFKDLERVGEESGKKQPTTPPLTSGEEYVSEMPYNMDSPQLQTADKSYVQALKFLERGRPQGTESKKAAYRLLEQAAEAGHRDAMKLIGFAYMFGDRTRWSLGEAKDIFSALAKTGSADAQLALGFMHATGVGMATSNQGYRYLTGVGVAASCEQALLYYQKVAEQVARSVKFAGGVSVQRIRLTDENDPTSTWAATSPMDSNLLEYYKLLAEKGDVTAQMGLGQIFLTGGRGVEQNFDEANRYLTSAAESGNAAAFAYLGKMYLDGTIATPQDNVTAFQFFLKSADKSNQIGQAGLGIMYMQGRGVRKDYDKAMRLFMLAAEQGHVEGQLYLGVMYYNGWGVKRDFKQAVKYFSLSSQGGHILAYYNLANMHANGLGVVRNCQTAVEFYKNVAERGRWAEKMMEAYNAYQNKRRDEAALKYLFMAEIGYEQAQTNFAFILDRGEASSLFPGGRETQLERALLQWKRAADQDYPLARIKLGDYYYYGEGTQPNLAEAAYHYKVAMDRHQNAQAMFNLGYMHEHGIGIAQDLHLAKRFYDMATEHSEDAFAPVLLALFKLYAHFALQYLTQTPLMSTALGLFLENDHLAMAASGLLIFVLVLAIARRQWQRRDPEEHLHID